MAQPTKSTHVVDIQVQKNQIDSLLTTLQEIGRSQKLNNTNGNTFNAILKEAAEAQKKLKPLQPSSKTDIATLKEIDDIYSKILRHLNTIIFSEKSLGETTSDYSKRLATAVDKLKSMRKELEALKSASQNLGVSPEGKVKKTQQKTVMNSAIATSRGKRPGPNNAAEQILATSTNMTEVQKLTSSEDPKIVRAATEAIKLYEAEVARLAQIAENTKNSIEALNDEIIEQKQIVSEIESTPGGYDPTTVTQLQTANTGLEKSLKDNEEYRKSLISRGETEVQLGEKIDINSGIFNKAATSLFNYSILYRTLQNLMKQAVQTVIQMDDAITGLSVVTGKSRDELQSLIPQFKELAQSTASTITEVAGLTEEYVKQGRTLKDAIVLAEQTAKAAKIAGISVGDSIQYMTSAINGFNLAAKDAEHVSDVFAKLAAESATDYENLAIALSKVSAQANTAGMSIEYTTALLAKGIETTQEAPESIGTALKTIIARMREITDYGDSLDVSAPINKVEKALKSAGISLRDTSGQFRSLEDIFNELGPKWDNLNTMQQQAIAQAVAGTRQQSRFLAIMQDWDRTIELTSSATDAAGESQYQYNQVAQSLSASITRLTTAWQSFISGLVDNEAIKGLLDTATSVLNTFNSIAESMNSWGGDSGILGTATTLGTILVIVGAIIQKIRAAYDERMQTMHKQIELLDKIKQQNEGEAEQQQRQNALQQKENEIMSERLGIIDKLKYKTDEYHKKLVKDDKNIKEDKEKFKTWKKQWKEEREHKNTLNKINKKGLKDKTKEINLSNEDLEIYNKEIEKRKESLAKQKEALITEKTNLETTNAKLKKEIESADINTDQAAVQQLQVELQTNQNALKEVDADLENTIKAEKSAQTVEEGQQLNYEQAQTNLQNTQIAQNATQIQQEASLVVLAAKRVGHELKTFAFKVGQAMSSYFTMAAAGLAIAAVTSLIGNIGGAISTAINPGKAESIRETQDTINENKKKSSNLATLRDEYQDLYIKQQAGTISKEERERMDEIIDEIKEIDSSITGTGQVLIDSIAAAISTNDEKTAKLIKENYANLKKNRGGLSASEASLAASQYADVYTRDTMRNNASLTAKQQQLTIDATAQILSGFDYDEYVQVLEENSGWDEFWNTKDAKQAEEWGRRLDGVVEKATTLALDMSNALTATENSLWLQVEAYNKAVGDATDTEKEVIEGAYSTLAVLSDLSKETLIGLEKTIGNQTVMTSGQILEFTATMQSLGMGAGTVQEILETLYQSMVSGADTMTAAMIKVDTYKKMLAWTDEEWKEAYIGDSSGEERVAREKEWTRMVESGDIQGYKNTALSEAANVFAGYDISKTRERVTTHKANVEEIYDIIDSLLDGNALSMEQLDLLAGDYSELMSSETFATLLSTNPQEAALKLIDEVDKVVNAYKNSYIGQETLLADIQDLEKKIALETDQDKKEGLLQDLETLKAQYNANDIAIQSLSENTVELLDVFEETINAYDTALDALDKKLSKSSGNLNIIKEMADLSINKMTTAADSINATVNKMMKESGITSKEELMQYFDIIDGQLIPKTEELNKNTKLRRIWLQNKEALKSYYEAYSSSAEKIEELVQQATEDAISNQEYYLDFITSAYEKEAEALQKSLDERRDMYDKYFDALEGEEETADYESDRQALINRIAKLSTATDSESLKQLKEAQKELADLNKEQASSQREARREAVSERLDIATENIEKMLEEKLNDGQKLWEEMVNILTESGEDLSKMESWFQSLGLFDGMTDLQKEQWLSDYTKNFDTTKAYLETDYTTKGIYDAVTAALSQISPSTNSYEGDDNSSINFSAAIDQIIIGDNTSLTASEIEAKVETALEKAWQNIIAQYGYNININPN